MKWRNLKQGQQAASRGTQTQGESWVRILCLTINSEQHTEPLGTGFFKITARLYAPKNGLGGMTPTCHTFLYLNYPEG